ncbi:MAG: hypothetical protein UU73_C0003G0040 [Candidatus Daviesbacteria bacterium GW2011_GWA1_41_61]|uniref:HIT domain-containing protein n=1 Tax=Candidatus Daviesbacteria bacterium GW2011_GWA2_40_9 TaxID=1618424 RepID=A0A0G0U2F3_9BACT|nr:MAG: hypothetical protein UU26_C0005G0016 [Candidatus Daviesbacteria bacterium GW2011_GWC1_40_9]KKR83263.1 MAG: hypothetical protein UU29_C0007G0133 [Candidatus Daviesbacteria bacterium GW2011_GWA2_40_9]KKR93608.1 MAG: hypothetical protein UU44_C0002G0269 [Candidatus Daviesbacteria bacterium GW2011_GWB1_41_15]KKS14841.1 MAG: hypothetical protein UU73_C0003G0040 [Candidatus Daviesbacteria bacterium GW2011_GWA1_41_61]
MYRTKKSEDRYQQYRKTESRCPFCTLSGERIIEETKSFYLIKNIYGYDIWDRRKVKIHLLLISKNHIAALQEIEKDMVQEYTDILKKYSERGFDIFTRATVSLTKSQPHFHTHLIKTTGRLLKSVHFNEDPYFLHFS